MQRDDKGFLTMVAAVAGLVLLLEALLAFGMSDQGLGMAASAEAAAPAPTATPTATPIVVTDVSAPAAPTAIARTRVKTAPVRVAGWPSTPTATPTKTATQPAVAGQPATAQPVAPFTVLNAYLERHNSSMMGLGEEFWKRGQQYNVDPRLMIAISGNETGFGRLLVSRYNPFNWFFRGTFDSHFDSWEQAIETVTRGIRLYYLDEDLTNLEKLGAKYGPIGAANDPQNLNVNFVPNVTRLLRDQGGDPERLTFN